MAFPEQIETERLILKRPAPATFDLATRLYEVADKSRESLREWLPWPDKTHSPEDEYTHYLIEWCQKHWEEESGFAFIITLKESGEIIGCVDCCHISPKDKCGEIGYWLSKFHVGKGYMQESVQALQAAAFEWGLNRIYIRNDTLNSRSVHIPERLGYHLDGVMRQDCWDEVHQRFRNTNFWSLLKSEWEEKFFKKGKKMATLKAGVILINPSTHKIGLVYREKRNDYSFPKGHLEKGETLQECAVRETAEETKRACRLLSEKEIYLLKYTTPAGEECENYMYVAEDIGPSDNTSWDTHDLHWVEWNEVEKKLSYQNLKEMWHQVKEEIKGYLTF